MHPRWRRCSSLKYCPIFSVVAPCHRGASPPSVRRRTFHHGLLYSDAMTDGKAPSDKTWDVVGLGANSVDFVHLLPGYPQPFGSFAKMRIEKQEILCGGQTATAMCACAKLGLRAKYAGVT